jgi:hypothetical protein
MKSYTKLPSKQLYLILILCAIIIFFTSIETMMKVKDVDLYQEWLHTLDYLNSSQITQDQSFESYLMVNLIFYFFKVIIPIALSVNAYLAYTRIRINYLLIFIWSVLALGGLAYTVVEMSFYSVFYYVSVVSYIILFIVILSLIDVINESKLL